MKLIKLVSENTIRHCASICSDEVLSCEISTLLSLCSFFHLDADHLLTAYKRCTCFCRPVEVKPSCTKILTTTFIVSLMAPKIGSWYTLIRHILSTCQTNLSLNGEDTQRLMQILLTWKYFQELRRCSFPK